MFNFFKSLKNENKILVMLAFFSISVGLWGNFRQLWLHDNNMSVPQIGFVLSVGTYICAILMFLIAKHISLGKIKAFITTCMAVKTVAMVVLFLSYKTGLSLPFLQMWVVCDLIAEKLIIASIYPFLITVRKDDILYSKRKLVEYLFQDVGVLIGGLFVGRMLFGLDMGYNVFLFISIVFMGISLSCIHGIVQNKIRHKKEDIKNLVATFFNDPLLRIYFAYYFIGTMAYNTALGLKMLMVTTVFDFSAGTATNYFLIVGLIADAIGFLFLKYCTPKNDYVTMTIKFGFRFLFYFLAFLTNSIPIMLLAITWSLLIATAYENITDAPYINRIKNTHQVPYGYLRYVIGISANATGLFLGGLLYPYGVRYMLGMSAFLMIFQIGLAYYLIYLRGLEKKKLIDLETPNSTLQSKTVTNG